MFVLATQTVAAPVVALQQSAGWICIDLETGDAPESAIEAAIATWKPPGNCKTAEAVTAERDAALAEANASLDYSRSLGIEPTEAEKALVRKKTDKIEAAYAEAMRKIDDRRMEAAERIRERAALLDASPILCVALQSEKLSVLFSGMDHGALSVEGWEVIPCRSEREMLIQLREWLEIRTGPQTVIVGHNIRAFDLPKLRHAYLRNGLRLPELFKPRLRDEERAEVVDTANLFKAFSMEHRDDFCPNLDTVAAGLGIPRPKGVINGADVPRLHRAGEFAAICTYCAIDAACTARTWKLMISAALDLA